MLVLLATPRMLFSPKVRASQMKNKIEGCLIGPKATVHEAVATIDRGRLQVALVVDETQYLLGTVTDGDIRRGLLLGIALEAPVSEVMQRNPTVITFTEGVEKAQTIMREKTLLQVPIVDDDGRLVDLVTINDAVGSTNFDTRIILMAGGLGRRLRPLTDQLPKPMLRIGNRPLLENIIRNFLKQGFNRFTLSLNYQAEIIKNHFGDGRKIDCEIDYIHETERMGTAGALSLLKSRPTNPFVVMNGDLLTTARFDALMKFHVETGSAATVCAREYSMQVPYGVLHADGTKLQSIEEKPTKTYFVNGGIYVLSPTVLDHLEPGTPIDMPEFLDRLMASGQLVSVFPIREYWIDIGRVEDLDRARSEYAAVFES